MSCPIGWKSLQINAWKTIKDVYTVLAIIGYAKNYQYLEDISRKLWKVSLPVFKAYSWEFGAGRKWFVFFGVFGDADTTASAVVGEKKGIC